MTDKEKAELADIIASKVVDELLMIVKLRNNINSFGFEDLYKAYEEDFIKDKNIKTTKDKKNNSLSEMNEVDLLGEYSGLLTKISAYINEEEYEKCTDLRKKANDIRDELGKRGIKVEGDDAPND